jgi:hypothetical protein
MLPAPEEAPWKLNLIFKCYLVLHNTNGNEFVIPVEKGTK